MKPRIPTIGSAAVLVAVLLTGCGEKDSPPAPTATTSAAITTTTAAPSALAKYATAPCSVLTDAQRTTVSKTGSILPKGRPDDKKPLPTCVFGDYQHTEKGYYFVTVYIDTKQGLAAMTKDEDFWKPDKLGDRQVVYYTHEGSQESCDVAIGFTDTTRVVIELYDFDNVKPREQGSCKGTKAVAEQVVATIDGGA
jgi:hypothetical protein